MEWLQSLFGEGNGGAMQLVIMTLALVAVIAIVVWLFRMLAGFSAKRTRRGDKPRLSVIDVAAVDDKRHLVLVRRDDVEHLVMVGGGSDVLIEAGIEIAETASIEQTEDSEPEASQQLDQEQQSADANLGTTTTIAAATASTSETVGGTFSDSAQSIKKMLLEQQDAKTESNAPDRASNRETKAFAATSEPTPSATANLNAEETETPHQEKQEAGETIASQLTASSTKNTRSEPSIDDILAQLREADKK